MLENIELIGRIPVITENILRGDYIWVLVLLKAVFSFPLGIALILEAYLKLPDQKLREYVTRQRRKAVLFLLLTALFVIHALEIALRC